MRSIYCNLLGALIGAQKFRYYKYQAQEDFLSAGNLGINHLRKLKPVLAIFYNPGAWYLEINHVLIKASFYPNFL